MRKTVLSVCATLMFLSGTGPAQADLWKKYGGDCDKVAFSDPGSASTKVLARCIRRFAAYRSVEFLKKDVRKAVIVAAKRLLNSGSDLDAHIAFWTLRRLGVMNVKPRSGTAKIGSSSSKERVATTVRKDVSVSKKKCKLDVPEDKAVKKAKKLLKAAKKLIRKEKYSQALGIVSQINEVAEGWHSALRVTALVHTLMDKPKPALKSLKCLRDMGGKAYLKTLRSVRLDKRFASLRRIPAFKRITGYAQIALLDTLPDDRGVENMEAFEVLLKKVGYPVYQRKQVDGNKTHPTLLYGPYSRGVAYLLSKLVDHPRLKVQPMPKRFVKDYHKKKGYDIIFYWGDRYDPNKPPKKRFPDPKDAENVLADVERKQNEMLRSPDKYTREVDKVLGTPDKVMGRVDRNLDKVKRITDTPKKIIDKGKSILNRF